MPLDLSSNNNINQMMNDILNLKRELSSIEVSGNDKYYRHTQGISSASWTVVHNLGKRPSVTVTDSAGTMILGQVHYVDDNTVQLDFSSPFSGYAECN